MKRWIVLGLSCLVLVLAADGAAAQQAKPSKKLQTILKDLKDRDAKTRLAALQDLERLAEVKTSDAQPAVPTLLKMLHDPDAGVRKAVLNALNKLEVEPKQMVTPLIELLRKDKDAGVRLAAVSMLGQIGPPAKVAVPILKELEKTVKGKPKDKLLAGEVAAALKRIQGK